MTRLLTLLIIGMIAYFTIKNMLRGPQTPMPKPGPNPDDPRDNRGTVPPDPDNVRDMVRDPVCQTYVEAGSALSLIHHNQKYFFCSPACRDRFLAGRE